MGMPVEKKENRTWAIVGTVLAILLCGCPGLTMCLFGLVFAFGKIPDTTDTFGGTIPSWVGFSMMCLALIFIAIAVVVPILLLRKKKAATEAVTIDVLPPQPPQPPQSPLPPQDPLPPTS
ncbi:MAG TPA: hypothetical protein VMT91_15755 [Anaerolineales bacterium]|nr:hypothetical protein [Anaerolineales bacterium]